MEAPKKGKLILVVGPTGSGKSVLINYIRDQYPEMIFALSYTTREKRPGHENNDYRFLSVEEFQKDIDAGEFLEWAQFGGNYYGTRKEEVSTALSEGKVLLKEMEVQGVRQTQALLPSEQVVIMYVDAGSWEELERRVRARAPITEEELEKRKKRYEDEITFKEQADFVIQNFPDELDTAKGAIRTAVDAILDSVRA